MYSSNAEHILHKGKARGEFTNCWKFKRVFVPDIAIHMSLSLSNVLHSDLVAIPDFAAGAMENWGLITYRETALLYDNFSSSTSDKQRVAVVIAHELAHQASCLHTSVITMSVL